MVFEDWKFPVLESKNNKIKKTNRRDKKELRRVESNHWNKYKNSTW